MIQPNKIKSLREDRKLTVRELAKLLDVAPSLVSEHENCTKNLSNDMLKKYSKIFKCETHELFIDLE